MPFYLRDTLPCPQSSVQPFSSLPSHMPNSLSSQRMRPPGKHSPACSESLGIFPGQSCGVQGDKDLYSRNRNSVVTLTQHPGAGGWPLPRRNGETWPFLHGSAFLVAMLLPSCTRPFLSLFRDLSLSRSHLQYTVSSTRQDM